MIEFSDLINRAEYDTEMNKLTLQIHYSFGYQYREGALKPRAGMTVGIDLVIDQRKTAADLYQTVIEVKFDFICFSKICLLYKCAKDINCW